VAGASGTRRFIYDGTDRVGDADTVGNWVANYVYGPGEDEPIVVHAQPAPVYLSSDERGSIISQSLDVTGAVVAINRYDEFGQPQSTNAGTFGYTGQAWIPDLKLWYYKARMYAPTIGRFLQTDPIGYGSGPNLYAYVRGDPVNLRDPLGLSDRSVLEIRPTCYPGDICITAPVLTPSCGIFCNSVDPKDLVQSPLAPSNIGLGGGASPGSPTSPTDKPSDKPQKRCPSGNVALSGTIYAVPAGPSYFSGTLTDVATGQSYSVRATGFGGGAIVGSYDVTGTVSGFGALNGGFDISYAIGPWGTGGASFTTNSGQPIGQGTVNSAAAPPIGAGGASFDPPSISQTNPGHC